MPPTPSRANRFEELFGSKKALLRTTLMAFGALFAVGILAFTILAAWISRDLPDPNSLGSRNIAQSTKIYDRTGTHLLYEIHGDEKRTLVSIDKIPLYMQKATIAIEDRGFYEHHGIYWRGLFRAVIVNTLKGQRISGTSTLTQQLVKNAVLTNERSFLRKVKEFILSLQIERAYTKDQIIQMCGREMRRSFVKVEFIII
jgi:membrane peptidoglycan carboxypeptidase